MILKVHGGVDPRPDRDRESFVVSEDDYIGYLAQSDLANVVPVTLAAKLRRSHLLFIAYPVVEWSLRVFLHRVFGDEPISYRSWAVLPGRASHPARVLASARCRPLRRSARGLRRPISSGGSPRCGRRDPGQSLTRGSSRSRTAGSTRCSSSGASARAAIIAENLLAARLTVLYGPSGVGRRRCFGPASRTGCVAQADVNVEERGHPEFAVVVFDVWSEEPTETPRATARGGSWPLSSARRCSTSGMASALAETLGRWTRRARLRPAADSRPGRGVFPVPRGGERIRRGAAGARHAAGSSRPCSSSRCATTHSRSSTASRAGSRTCSRTTCGSTTSIVARHEKRSCGPSSASTSSPASRSRWSRSSSRRCSTRLRQVRSTSGMPAAGWRADERAPAGSRRPTSSSSSSGSGKRSGRRARNVLRAETLAALGGAESIVRAHLRRAVEELTVRGEGRGGRRLPLPRHAIRDKDRSRGRGPRRVRFGRRAATPAGSLDARSRAHRPDRRRCGGGRRRGTRSSTTCSARRCSPGGGEQELERERRAAERRHRRLAIVALARSDRPRGDDGGRDLRLRQRARGCEQRAARKAEARELVARSSDMLNEDPLDSVDAGRAGGSHRAQHRISGRAETRLARLPSAQRILRAGAGPVNAAAYDPRLDDGRDADADGTARLFSTASGARIAVLETRRTP